MRKIVNEEISIFTEKRTKIKIGILEIDQGWYQSLERFLSLYFEVSAISLKDIIFNNIDIGEYHSILVYYGIRYEAIDISATLDLITIIKNFSAKPPSLLLITDYADSQITAEARSYLPQIDGVFAKNQDLALLLKILKAITKQRYFS